jgi:hypothetical protein
MVEQAYKHLVSRLVDQDDSDLVNDLILTVESLSNLVSQLPTSIDDFLSDDKNWPAVKRVLGYEEDED